MSVTAGKSAARAPELLVSAETLRQWINAGSCCVFDCRFDLKHPDKGREAWLAGHIPGAIYAHLDDDLAGPVTSLSGRHPLPEPEVFAGFLARSGWSPGMRTAAYDDSSGAIAARLWWLMRYFDAGDLALLDGGLSAWTSAGFPLERGEIVPAPAQAISLSPRPAMVVGAEQAAEALARREITLLDARAADRFAGQNETIDPVAGHIPGARNRPFSENLQEGRFRTAAAIRKSLQSMADQQQPYQIVHMCGSGVTACHNLFAMELAGLSGSRLYPGSWSEWIRDPKRPIVVGDS